MPYGASPRPVVSHSRPPWNPSNMVNPNNPFAGKPSLRSEAPNFRNDERQCDAYVAQLPPPQTARAVRQHYDAWITDAPFVRRSRTRSPHVEYSDEEFLRRQNTVLSNGRPLGLATHVRHRNDTTQTTVAQLAHSPERRRNTTTKQSLVRAPSADFVRGPLFPQNGPMLQPERRSQPRRSSEALAVATLASYLIREGQHFHQTRNRMHEPNLTVQHLKAQRLEAERREAQRLQAQRLEAQRLEAQRLEAQRLEAERLEAEQREAERREAERREALDAQLEVDGQHHRAERPASKVPLTITELESHSAGFVALHAHHVPSRTTEALLAQKPLTCTIHSVGSHFLLKALIPDAQTLNDSTGLDAAFVLYPTRQPTASTIGLVWMLLEGSFAANPRIRPRLQSCSPVAVVCVSADESCTPAVDGHTIFVHSYSDPPPSAFDTKSCCVRDLSNRLQTVVALMERAPGFGFIPVLKHSNGREFHVFVCPDATDAATQKRNEATYAYIRSVINDQLPRVDVCLGGCLADAMTQAIDAARGTGEIVRFTAEGTFVVDASHASAAPNDGTTMTDVSWEVVVERDWSSEDDGERAYVLEFKMDGLNDAAAEAEVRRQLAWGEGIKLERRGRSVSEEVTVNVRGPNGQRLRALTSLQEHNVGESGAPVVVRVSVDGVVRVQFWPGQIDDQ